MVRNIKLHQFRAPWTFVHKQGGWRKIGPIVVDAYKWPGQRKEIPELSPKFQQNNRPELRGKVILILKKYGKLFRIYWCSAYRI